MRLGPRRALAIGIATTVCGCGGDGKKPIATHSAIGSTADPASRPEKPSSPPALAHIGDAVLVSVSPSGDYAATVGKGGDIVTWDLKTHQVVGQLAIGSSPRRLVLLDRDKILTITDHGELTFWDSRSNKAIWQSSERSDENNKRLASEAASVLVAGPGSEPVVYDGININSEVCDAGGKNCQVRAGYRGPDQTAVVYFPGKGVHVRLEGDGVVAMSSVALSADTKVVVGGLENGEVHVWTTGDGKRTQKISAPGRRISKDIVEDEVGAPAAIEAVGFLGDGGWFAVTGRGWVDVYDNGAKLRGSIKVPVGK